MHLDQQLTCQTTVITQRMVLEPGPHTGSDLTVPTPAVKSIHEIEKLFYGEKTVI